MKVRIVRRMPLATRTSIPLASRRSPPPRLLRFLQWSRDAFLVAGVLALGYCGYVLLDTKLYQAFQTRRFQQELTSVRPANASLGGIHKLPVVPIPGGALGKIEIARIGLAAMILEGID